MTEQLNDRSPVFPIAAAAQLSGMHPQTLRQYDRLGLVQPQRTAGNTRRYSMRDIGRLREVQRLSGEGMGIGGIRRVLELEDEVRGLQQRVQELEHALATAAIHYTGTRVFAAGTHGTVPIKAGTRPSKSASLVVWRPSRHGGDA